MRSTLIVSLGLMLGAGMLGATAKAEPQAGETQTGGVRQAVEASIALEESRIGELQKIAATSRDVASALEAEARGRDASAAEFYARSKEFTAAASLLKGPSRAKVTGFATAMNKYARTDQEMARAARDVAGKRADQAKSALANVEAHRKHVAELRQSLEDWK